MERPPEQVLWLDRAAEPIAEDQCVRAREGARIESLSELAIPVAA